MRLSEMRTEVTPQQINKIVESRFGFSVDYFHRAPRVAYNSIFSVFEQNSTDEISVNTNYLLGNKNAAIYAIDKAYSLNPTNPKVLEEYDKIKKESWLNSLFILLD